MINNGTKRCRFFEVIVVSFFILHLFSANGLGLFADASEKNTSNTSSAPVSVDSKIFPTREKPILIDEKGKRVYIYTEVHAVNVHRKNSHWGVVFKYGKLQDKAILRAYVNPLDFYDALLKIGAKPGNNLSKDTAGQYVQGDTLEVRVTWPGLGQELSLKDIFVDEKGNPFIIKFGGNRKASEQQNTGCITCLESCWISISSNATYPQTGSLKRFFNPGSQFRGNANTLPGDGKPVILIYRVAGTQ